MNSTAQPARGPLPTAAAPANAPLPHAQPREKAQAQAHAPAKPRRRGMRRVIAGLVILGVLLFGGRLAWHMYHYEETDDAYVTGHLHTVSAQVDGQVKQVLVNDNQVVHAGDVLLQLDPLQYQIALDRAKAALAQAAAQEQQLKAAATQADAALAEAQAHVQQAEAQRAQTAAQLDLAKVTLARNEQLVRENSAARSELDQARSSERAADAANAAAEANLLAARTAVNSAQGAQVSAHDQIEAAHAAVAAAQAAQHEAERQLAYTTVKAPADGRVGNKNVEAGNRVQAGQALLALAEPTVWVTANFKETQLARMRVGQPVEMTIDAIPGTTFEGRVDSFSPASGAQFALLPPDNATGNFNKVVQRVPVKITFDPNEAKSLGNRLRLGLSVVVNVRVR